MNSVSSCPEHVYFSYTSLPVNTPKLFANFKAMDHNAVVDKNIFLVTSGNAAKFLPTMVSWFKVYLANDSRYQCYLDTTGIGYAPIKPYFTAKGSVPAYIYCK